MLLLLRNFLAVILIQPSRFVDPRPQSQRVQTIASVLICCSLDFLCSAPIVLLFSMAGLLSLWVRLPLLARTYGSHTPWRAVFAYAWCTTIAAAATTLVGSPAIAALLLGYVVVAISAQTARVPRALLESSTSDSDTWASDRARAQAAKAAFGAAGRAVRVALGSSGVVDLIEIGPAVARWKDCDIPDYVVDATHRTWQFRCVAVEARQIQQISPGELLLPPGALYELDEPSRH